MLEVHAKFRCLSFAARKSFSYLGSKVSSPAEVRAPKSVGSNTLASDDTPRQSNTQNMVDSMSWKSVSPKHPVPVSVAERSRTKLSPEKRDLLKVPFEHGMLKQVI